MTSFERYLTERGVAYAEFVGVTAAVRSMLADGRVTADEAVKMLTDAEAKLRATHEALCTVGAV